jgi:hypothetical protein
MMLEELQRRNYSQSTTRAYVRVVHELAAYFHQPPDRLGPDHLRQFSGTSVSRAEAECTYRCPVQCGITVFLREDAETA